MAQGVTMTAEQLEEDTASAGLDTRGPTDERKAHASVGKEEFFEAVGRAKSERRTTMLDNTLGRALMRRNVSEQEYHALRRYGDHWLNGGLCGPLRSVDLDRIYAVNLSGMSGLARSEWEKDHRDTYYAARQEIGFRLGWVADHAACYDTSMTELGRMMGYRSDAHGRERGLELLREAGYRLGRFWAERDRRHA
jgi:hypothetical protein